MMRNTEFLGAAQETHCALSMDKVWWPAADPRDICAKGKAVCPQRLESCRGPVHHGFGPSHAPEGSAQPAGRTGAVAFVCALLVHGGCRPSITVEGGTSPLPARQEPDIALRQLIAETAALSREACRSCMSSSAIARGSPDGETVG